MKVMSHTLGFPRIGVKRELKVALENYWSGKISKNELLSVGKMLRHRHWKQQKDRGIDFIPVGDFSWYDHVLGMSMLLGNIPERHKNKDETITLDTMFRISRGDCSDEKSGLASDMTKWFNTNYHYIVPEFTNSSSFKLSWLQLFEEIDEALLLYDNVKPIILGPLTYLWLGKVKGSNFDKLTLLNKIIPIYVKILLKLKERGVTWVQIDEPILVLELPENWKKFFYSTYYKLFGYTKLLLTTYFGGISHNLDLITKLPVQGLHLDLVSEKCDLSLLNSFIPKKWLVSLGIINGRNVWRSNLKKWFVKLKPFIEFRDQIWIAPSCSLLHSPIDLNFEARMSKEVKSWLSFSLQKCEELSLLKNALNNNVKNEIELWSQPIYDRSNSNLVNDILVQNKVKKILLSDVKRDNVYSVRSKKQKKRLNLPLFPTTTIGSFPQTQIIRNLRLDYKLGNISFKNYQIELYKHIKSAISFQENLDIDVLVHGEFERNDMVEYFGENLNGFVFTDNGWVQSYGSRCVKPPIIVGDVSRSKSITIDWITYAQSLTNKPVKGMLTGPMTILCWSFLREDLSEKDIANQIALSLRDEVLELEKEGISIIQIDEPALREGLPLRCSLWNSYFSWAIKTFQLSCFGVRDDTQIHTHMCYCEFNEIMDAIVLLDVDVITIETSRSDMELLEFFKNFEYPNGIGPGVYDVHSPSVPSVKWITSLLEKAINYIPIDRLWVNPDCGLKTRNWDDTKCSLENMVQAAKIIRENYN
ncbi:5-methyltetrahydropteroyltriglutamate--homocysteine methyltransferase [Buchnera aphidicola (Schlechtendalia chinensis)]|uniref:5-methyltetrahydropteroyltriglutamate--homocysteine methyltransferase n=1 Tax=Buchnera aphidicola subsp. Schlechtendalia chinensis TaxID=118110 RepID=A0A172WD12_BUCSC|nr:5-methyltetrahydropteroyltriglutamate--homocysteine S-methyltransferase [Buchnera aphidicola]ANF16853.1 5-methyltetrahydropteroyltriglutamate--homocysteine methyltransferase [Buchnera aphidicola (Schlechtendalia chinensis)]